LSFGCNLANYRWLQSWATIVGCNTLQSYRWLQSAAGNASSLLRQSGRLPAEGGRAARSYSALPPLGSDRPAFGAAGAPLGNRRSCQEGFEAPRLCASAANCPRTARLLTAEFLRRSSHTACFGLTKHLRRLLVGRSSSFLILALLTMPYPAIASTPTGAKTEARTRPAAPCLPATPSRSGKSFMSPACGPPSCSAAAIANRAMRSSPPLLARDSQFVVGLRLLRCWRRSFICMLFLFVKLSFCLSPQHPAVASVQSLPQSPPSPFCPSRLHPQPRGFCSSSAGGSRLRDSRWRAAVAAGLQSPLPPPASRHPLRRRHQRRRSEDSVRSRTRRAAASPEAGFTMASELLASCAALLLVCSLAGSCCSTACCFCPVLAGSRPLLQADCAAVSENINSTSTIEFCHVLARKRAHFGANSISRLSRPAAAREGRVLLAPRPVEAGAPAGATQALPIFSDSLRASGAPETKAQTNISCLERVQEEAERQQQDEQQRAEHPAGVRGAQAGEHAIPDGVCFRLASLVAACQGRRLRRPADDLSADRTAAPQHRPKCLQLQPTALSQLALLCSQLHWHLLCSQLLTALQLAAALSFTSASSFTWHCSALSFTWHCSALSFTCTALLSASPGTALLSASPGTALQPQLHTALLCSQLHLALLSSSASWTDHCSQPSLTAAQLTWHLLALSFTWHALSRDCGSGCGRAGRPEAAWRWRCAAARLSSRPPSWSVACFAAAAPESPSQRPAQKTPRALMSLLRLVVLQPADVGPDDAQGRLSGVLAGPSLRGPDEGLVLKVSQPFTSARWNSSLNWRAKPGTMAPSLRSSGPKLRGEMERRQLRDGRSLGRQGHTLRRESQCRRTSPEDLQSIGVGSNVADEVTKSCGAPGRGPARSPAGVSPAQALRLIARARSSRSRSAASRWPVALPHEVPHRLRLCFGQAVGVARTAARFSAMGCSSLEGWGGKNT
uniref:Transmembrane protein n=1 Tax=Macrostomum lignano TaxID=282301 RepID=A0A1I8F684_9PLAT